jgi:hypothetical protein
MDSALMTEANVLADLSFTIKQQYKTDVTIIPISRPSDLRNLLNRSPIIFLQFKRPYSYSSERNNNYTKFVIEMRQHQELLQSFIHSQVFYIFAALNGMSEIISNRKDFMKYCIALDIHNIPTDIRLLQKTRVVRMVKASLSPKLEVAGRRKFEALSNLMTLEELSNNFAKGLAGMLTLPGVVPITGFAKDFKIFAQHMYAIHLGTESAAAS